MSQLQRFVLLIFISLSQTSIAMADDNELRMIVAKGCELIYNVKSETKGDHMEALNDLMGSQFLLRDNIFGEEVNPQQYAICGKNEKAIVLRDHFPLATELIFIPPPHLGFTKSGETKTLTMDTNVAGTIPMIFEVKARFQSSGWSYTCNFVANSSEIHLRKGKFINQPLRLVTEMQITVNTNFDKNNKRVKSASMKCQFTSSFKNASNQTITNNNELSSKVTFDEQRHVAESHKSKVKHAIDHSKNHLWQVLSSNYRLNDTLKKLKRNDRQHAYDKGYLGESGLCLLAVIRAGMDPDDNRDLEKMLLAYVELFDYFYFSGNTFYETWPVYDYAVALMLFDAALNPIGKTEQIASNDTEVNKRGRKKFRGSKTLIKNILSTAEKITKKLSQGKGHVWDYEGTRHRYKPGGYSRAQYAVLGLRSAKLLGQTVPDNVWTDICEGVVKDFMIYELKSSANTQSSDTLDITFSPNGFFKDEGNKLLAQPRGGWRYAYEAGENKIDLKFNMTCAALGNLAIASTFGNIKNEEMIKAITGGLAFTTSLLSDYLKQPHYKYYSFYSFERPAVFYGITKINGMDWHEVISEKIMAEQMTSGAFNHTRYGTVSCAYALLFLKKATRSLYSVSAGE